MTKYNIHFERRPLETSKAKPRREAEGFFDKYCHGIGIDIGCGFDPLESDSMDLEVYMFDACHGQGDAQFMKYISNSKFDYVYSSHLLEHVEDINETIRNWWRILKPGGYLILYVPERDLYEKKRQLPSRWNADHKRFFLLDFYEKPDTVGLVPWLGQRLSSFGPGTNYKILEARTLQAFPEPSVPNVHSSGEYSIEVIVKKLR